VVLGDYKIESRELVARPNWVPLHTYENGVYRELSKDNLRFAVFSLCARVIRVESGGGRKSFEDLA
jgi:hypothetical protein